MSSFEQDEFSANPDNLWHEVFGYPFIETRRALGSLSLDELFHINTLPVTEAANILHDGGYIVDPALELPAYDNGQLNLDSIHEPVIDRITQRNEPLLTGLFGFNEKYPTHGSSMAIRALMAEWSRTGKMTELAVVGGEYEGYEFAAGDAKHNLGLAIPVHKVVSLEDASDPVEGRVWFVSNPSAVNGNWHDDEVWQQFVAAGHDIVYDAAYVGLTAENHPIDVSAPNIKAVLTSPSKIFGTFRHRLTGIAYTREPVFSMIDTIWFKDVPALMATLILYETFEPNELPTKYKNDQLIICRSLTDHFGKTITPSDAILLSNTNETLPPEYSHYKRKPGTYRFGLTKLFEQLELHKQNAVQWYESKNHAL